MNHKICIGYTHIYINEIYIYIPMFEFLESVYLLGLVFCKKRMDLDAVLCSCSVDLGFFT